MLKKYFVLLLSMYQHVQKPYFLFFLVCSTSNNHMYGVDVTSHHRVFLYLTRRGCGRRRQPISHITSLGKKWHSFGGVGTRVEDSWTKENKCWNKFFLSPCVGGRRRQCWRIVANSVANSDANSVANTVTNILDQSRVIYMNSS